MGNTPGKESDSRSPRSPTSPSSATFSSSTSEPLSRHGRSLSGRHEGSFLGLVSSSAGGAVDVRKETRQEREARKLAKERAARAKERERSVREEHVDGGYLVTLGTYTGPEDFSKSTVRQLMVERRLAPFWRGLNDHSDSWTEHQLIAAALGKPIPAPDEIPEDENLTPPPASAQTSSSAQSPITAATTTTTTTTSTTSTQAVPVPQRKQGSDESNFPSGSNSAASLSLGLSPSNNASTSPLFRGRAKTLASLASSAKSQAQIDMTPQEIHLPREPFLNGMRIEAHLYKDVLECPICFLYYPPYLNKTRCCDQPICSECFVQIKRPEPHPPEHLDPNTPVPETPPRPEEENLLVSEPATCPFCVQAEFGVSYQPPPFRRGLAYAQGGAPMLRTNSAMSSASDRSAAATPVGSAPGSTPARRRAESLSANSPSVITTDKVRPDWAKKLSDARAHQARRAAAATALHTAAYLMNNNQGTSSSSPFSRRRRAETTGSANATSRAGPDIEQLMAVLETRRPPGQERHGSSGDLFPVRGSSQRATNAQDLEEIMLMEAIRLSIAAEEERQKKEEKEAAKQAKLDDKQRAKDQRETVKKGTSSPSTADGSTTQTRTDEPAKSASTLQQDALDGVEDDAKGKERTLTGASSSGLPEAATRTLPSLTPLAEPTSTLNTETAAGTKGSPDADSNAEGTDVAPSSSPPQKLEQTFNFQSLAEMIGDGPEEHASEQAAGQGDATAAGTKEQK